jgi:hypothetical protein
MPTIGTITTAALSIASFLVLAIVTAPISANVRRWANDKGHDGYLLFIANHIPARVYKMLAGWNALRQLWWLWLVLGASGGLGTALWLLAGPTPPSVIASTSTPLAMSKEEVETKLGVWDTVTHNKMGILLGALNSIELGFNRWPSMINSIPSSRDQLHTDIVQGPDKFIEACDDLEKLRSEYLNDK